MVTELARRKSGEPKVAIAISGQEKQALSQAATVIDHAPDLVERVLDGGTALYEACGLTARSVSTVHVPDLGI